MNEYYFTACNRIACKRVDRIVEGKKKKTRRVYKIRGTPPFNYERNERLRCAYLLVKYAQSTDNSAAELYGV